MRVQALAGMLADINVNNCRFAPDAVTTLAAGSELLMSGSDGRLRITLVFSGVNSGVNQSSCLHHVEST